MSSGKKVKGKSRRGHILFSSISVPEERRGFFFLVGIFVILMSCFGSFFRVGVFRLYSVSLGKTGRMSIYKRTML